MNRHVIGWRRFLQLGLVENFVLLDIIINFWLSGECMVANVFASHFDLEVISVLFFDSTCHWSCSYWLNWRTTGWLKLWAYQLKMPKVQWDLLRAYHRRWIFWPVNQSMPTFVPFPRSILLLIQGTVFMHNSIENIYCSVLRLLTCFLCAFILDIQVGCPLRCSFCATGKGGFSRNLKRHEIVEQVTLMSFPCPLFEVHCVVGWWGLWMFYCLRNSEKWSGQSRIEVFHSEEWKKKKKGN